MLFLNKIILQSVPYKAKDTHHYQLHVQNIISSKNQTAFRKWIGYNKIDRFKVKCSEFQILIAISKAVIRVNRDNALAFKFTLIENMNRKLELI